MRLERLDGPLLLRGFHDPNSTILECLVGLQLSRRSQPYIGGLSDVLAYPTVEKPGDFEIVLLEHHHVTVAANASVG